MNCPICGENSAKVIYFGLPMRLCDNEEDCHVFGFWSWILNFFVITDEDDQIRFLVYDGWYIIALFVWLFASNIEVE